MKRMKIMLSLVLAMLMLLSAMTACTPTEDPADTLPNEQSTLAVSEEKTTEQPTDASTEAPTDSSSEASTEPPAETTTEVPTETPTEIVTEPDTVPPTDTPSATDEETTPEAPPVDATVRPAQEVKVISMNLDANETTAGSRARRMAPLLLSFDPDSIGVQECRGGWGGLLKKHFISKGYARVGVDAGGNVEPTGGYFATYILYKEDKFNLIDSGTFWLSKTP
jgi:cytoskeletal protein RodZ